MKYRDNPMIDEMFGEVAIRPKTPNTVQVRCTDDEKRMYEELKGADVDMPFMIREFVVKLHGKVFPENE